MIPQHILEKISAADFILGCDECGIGSYAGPSVAGAVVVPRDWKLFGLTDSKKLTPKQREVLRTKLLSDPQVTYHLVQVDSTEIDSKGMGKSLREAQTGAIKVVFEKHLTRGLSENVFAIIDGVHAVAGAAPLAKADTLIQAVSAASVLAKTLHDEEMRRLDKLFPGYGWTSNQGYNSKTHMEGLKKLGVSPVHRKSYGPIKALLKAQAVPGLEEDDPFAEMFDFGDK